jgi:integrase
MAEGQPGLAGVTVLALLAACGGDIVGLRDAALISVAYDAGLRASELVGTRVADLAPVADGSSRLEIAHSKTGQAGEGALAWLPVETMGRVSAWLLAAGIAEGPVFRRINVLASEADGEGQQVLRHFIGAKPLTRQGVVEILRRRVLAAVDFAHIALEPGREGEAMRSLSAHSFRVGLTQDLFAAGEDVAGIALALRWSWQATAPALCARARGWQQCRCAGARQAARRR